MSDSACPFPRENHTKDATVLTEVDCIFLVICYICNIIFRQAGAFPSFGVFLVLTGNIDVALYHHLLQLNACLALAVWLAQLEGIVRSLVCFRVCMLYTAECQCRPKLWPIYNNLTGIEHNRVAKKMLNDVTRHDPVLWLFLVANRPSINVGGARTTSGGLYTERLGKADPKNSLMEYTVRHGYAWALLY